MLWDVDASRLPGLAEQIAGNVRRALADDTLAPGERLPSATDVAATLAVNPNTVLVAYRALRSEGVLEFSRGRGVRVRPDAKPGAAVLDAARRLVEIGRSHGYTPRELALVVEQL